MTSIQRVFAAVTAVVTSLLVAGCGGSGAGAQGEGGGTSGGVVEPAAVQITSSEPTLRSDGGNPATISVFVKDANNRAMANQQVTFALVDPVGSSGGLLKDIVSKTDASGTASATLQVTDPSNRTVTVRAQAGSLSGTIDVPVIGTTLALTGPGNVVLNAVTDYVVSLRDSNGVALSGRQVAVASSAGNPVSPATVTTNTAGQASFSLTATKSGADKITVNALGATASTDVAVASSLLSFVAPTSGQELEVTSALRPRTHSVQVEWRSGGAPVAGRRIDFVATRGAITVSGVTDANGRASATLSSPTAGSSTITARTDDGVLLATQRVDFVSLVPAKIAVQPSPANVGVNLNGSTANSSQLIAVVRDAADNPVKGQTVSFSAVSDPSNGRIEPGVATTDGAGVATVAFFPGANSTGNNQIVIQASIPGSTTVVPAQTTLTASKQELFVRVGTGNQLEEIDLATNASPWSAVVTDASGNPVVGATVQANVVSLGYVKGQYFYNAVLKKWYVAGVTSSDPVFSCPSEDLNGNLRLDVGEDTNGDGEITPGNVAAASMVSAGGKTDTNGLAQIKVIYPKSFGNWTLVQLRVTITTIAGTENATSQPFVLPVMAKDISNEFVAPPGQPSPFGVLPDCTTRQ
jgi:hypothetical protein